MIRKALYRVKSFVVAVICSFLATISYQIRAFKSHFNGPGYASALDDYFNYLKWEDKAGRKLDPWDAREKLAECLEDRGVNDI